VKVQLNKLNNQKQRRKNFTWKFTTPRLGFYSLQGYRNTKHHRKIQSVYTQQQLFLKPLSQEEKILPQDFTTKKQYEFATSFLKVGD
jgi:hypothetical protein